MGRTTEYFAVASVVRELEDGGMSTKGWVVTGNGQTYWKEADYRRLDAIKNYMKWRNKNFPKCLLVTWRTAKKRGYRCVRCEVTE